MTYAQTHATRVNRWFLLVYGLHLPVFLGVALYLDRDPKEAVFLALLGLGGPWLAHLFAPGSRLSSWVTGAGGMVLSAGLIHLCGGMIEAHFHVFVLIPLLSVFGRFGAVLAAALTIAAHHIAFFFFLPGSLFNYPAGFGIVLVHAVFVVLAAIPGALIARLINGYVVGAGEALLGIGQASQELNATAGEFASASTSLAKEANEQAAAVETSGESVRSLIESRRAGATLLNTLRTDALARLLQELGSAASAGAALASATRSTGEAASSIRGIVQTSEAIAFQTNILALNAAVEAARAGSAGAGFAVVADEVRNLATRSAGAARETGTLIESATSGIDRSGHAAAEVGENLRRIEAIVATITRDLERLAQAVDQDARELESIGAEMERLDRAAQENSARSEEMAASSQHLQEQARRTDEALRALRQLERGKPTGTPT